MDLELSLARGFRRFCRLLVNLPMEARWITKNVPTRDWNWDRETNARILAMLDIISCQLTNMHRKKGTKPRKPAQPFEPDYVTEAKKQFKAEKAHVSDEEMADAVEFWKNHNPNAQILGETKEENNDGQNLLGKTGVQGPNDKQRNGRRAGRNNGKAKIAR